MAGQRNGGDKNIESKDLLVLNKDVNENRGTTTVLRCVDWISNGKHYPQLEKREFYNDRDTGDLKMGKAKGMTVKDLGIIQDNWAEIMEALGNRLPEAGRGPARAAAPASAAAASEPAHSEQEF